MRSTLLRYVIVASLLLAGGYGLGHWLRGEPSQAAPASCPYSGGGPPFSLQSFEADRSRQLYLDTQRLAAANQLFPDDEEFQLFTLTVGEQRVENRSAVIPVEILYAIGWIESSTNQTSIEVPYGDVGPALLSFDCGYGIMQVTSSIDNDGGLPSRYEALVGTHFAYNIAAGARILAEKWNEALYPTVGAHDPRYIESWYYALWAYNGWAAINHPFHPSNDPFRSVYRCDGARNGYPYQELVLGCIINPPKVDGRPLWNALPVSLPDLSSLSLAGEPLDLDVFHMGLDNIYLHPGGGAGAPFAEMHMALPSSAQRLDQHRVAQAGAVRARALGQPSARLDIDELELTSSQLESGNVPLQIYNDGTGLLPWLIVEAPSWLSVDVQAGVALGSGYSFSNGPQSSRLRISAAAEGVPEGSHRGHITLEFHYPDGSSTTSTIAISLDKQGAAFYEAGRPQS